MILQRVTLLLTGVLCSGALYSQILPPIPVVPYRQEQGLATAPRLFVRGFQFEGHRAFTDAELNQVTGSFTNRVLGIDDLEQARRAVSLFYVDHGFVNSGALIPDQDPTNGIIRIQIVEGVLTGIELSGNRWLRDSYINSRLERWSTPPLNLNRLQEGLQFLRQNPNVRQINAELKPGTAPGEAVLDVRVADQQPFRLGIQVDNQRPPSIGAEEIWLLASDLNLTGHSDPLDIKYGIANATADGIEFSGADNMEASYMLPLNRYNTTLGLQGSRLNTAIVEQPFASLNIASQTDSYGFFLRQPLYQTARDEVALTLGFDHRQNTSTLLGEPFNISPGAVDGEMTVSVLQFSQEWLRHGQNHVLALRSTFNFGLDVLGATDNGITGDPNGTFFSWLGQGQYVQRLFNTQNEFILRTAVQCADQPLLALEQFSVGGFETVRGYLENQLVRDRGVVSSVEFRVPILYNKAGAGIVQLAPFFDFGGAWNVEGSPSPNTIYSVGVGLLLLPGKHFSAQIYWGYRLREVVIPDDSGVQGHGVDFKLNIWAF